MSNVINFAKMDILSLKQYKYYFLLLLGSLLLFLDASIGGFVIIPFFLLTMLSPFLFVSDEKNDMFRLYSSLPLATKEIVCGRYFSCILGGIIYIISMTGILFFAMEFFGLQWLSVEIIIYSMLLTASLFFISTALQYPIFFKKGYIKAKFWGIFPSYGIVMLILALRSILNIDLLQYFVNFPIFAIIAVLLLSIILLIASIILSIKIYEAKKN